MAAKTTESCLFNCNKTGPLIACGQSRITKIIQSSIERQDLLHIELQEMLNKQPETTIKCHNTCVSTYTSRSHIERDLKRTGCQSSVVGESPPKRRSQLPAFDFRLSCLICGGKCLPKNPKNPNRWRRVVQCRTLEMKPQILKICDERQDNLAKQVRSRVLAAVSDLHAADAQYHNDCFTSFVAKRSIAAASRTSSEEHIDPTDSAFKMVVSAMTNEPQKIWNSIELYNLFAKNTGEIETDDSQPTSSHCGFTTDQGEWTTRHKRAGLIHKLERHFGHSLLVMRMNGSATLLCFRKYVPDALKLVDANDDDPISEAVQIISQEINEQEKAKCDSYDFNSFTYEKMIEDTSDSLLRLVSGLVSSGSVTRESLCLTQSIQCLMTKTFNQTTLGLAVKLHHQFGSRELIDILHKSGYISSYDEVLRFRKSAAKITSDDRYIFRGVLNSTGLISAWFDNFDLRVFTANGCRETHCMAVELTQHPRSPSQHIGDYHDSFKIPRISKQAMNALEIKDLTSVEFHHFTGKKQPSPPALENHIGLPYDLVKRRQDSVTAAQESDVAWLVDVIKHTHDENPTPEWAGFMTRAARESNVEPQKATTYLFGPLIDSPPAHPDTILTTLVYIERFMRHHGAAYIHVSADMQLYKVVMQIKWSYPEMWNNLIIRPGGMHVLMSFVGCIGTLMCSSGLEDILGVAFKGVTHMMTGKAWPKALRGFRMVTEAIMEPFISSGKTTVEDIEEILENARSTRTGRLWVDCLVKPMFILNLYIRAEREGDWLLHQYSLQRMIPYFFAAGHWNYARYIQWHLIDMENSLPNTPILEAFLRGEHVCRHNDGVWNAVFLDQFGEQTYIRYGKAKGGLVGKTLSQEQVAEWTLSHHLCNSLSLSFDKMNNEQLDDDHDVDKNAHKEEGKRRKILDSADRNAIISEMKKHTNPLNARSDEPLINIVNGRVATDSVNVDNALSIGQTMASEFSSKLPECFYRPLTRKVTTMEVSKKSVKIEAGRAYDMEKLYARLLVISQKRDIQLDTLFEYELSPVPTSLFDEYGAMRKGTKSLLMAKLAVFASTTDAVDAEIIDGNEALYHTPWPKTITVKQFTEIFCQSLLRPHATYVVFDRYLPASIKSHERARRTGGFVYHRHSLHENSALPSRDTVMKCDENKTQLIRMLCNTQHSSPTLHLISEEQCPFNHEEADVNIISYLLMLQEEQKQKHHIQITADDTDIFVLLVHFVWKKNISIQVTMKKHDGSVIDINRTVQTLGDKCGDLLPLHAITGCDTVSYPFGKGKAAAVNLLMKTDLCLQPLCSTHARNEDIITAGTEFLLRLYGSSLPTNLNTLRYQIFSRTKEPPKIKSLPPTTHSAANHIKRAHLQTLIWCAADQTDPPHVDVCQFGWKFDKNNVPEPEYGQTEVAPASLLQVVACSCKSENPCGSNRCSCHSAGLSCTSYCRCVAGSNCANERTVMSTVVEDSDDE